MNITYIAFADDDTSSHTVDFADVISKNGTGLNVARQPETNHKKPTPPPGRGNRVQRVPVKSIVPVILTFLEEGGWKTGWNAKRVADTLGLTKMQVAAVKANFTMGRYN